MISSGRMRLSTLRFVCPEQRGRAAFLVLPAAWSSWRAFDYLGPAQALWWPLAC
jgi:hypothetical protein